MCKTIEITQRELATILPALVYWKEELAEGEDWIPESNYFQEHSPLTEFEIDALAARFERMRESPSPIKFSAERNAFQHPREFASFEVPTYFGSACPEKIERGEQEEFDDPRMPILVYKEAGLRILLGTHDIDDNNKPDIKIERRPKGWAIFLHPLGATDPSGYIYFLDDGRSFLVKDDWMLSCPIQILAFDEEVPGLDSLK